MGGRGPCPMPRKKLFLTRKYCLVKEFCSERGCLRQNAKNCLLLKIVLLEYCLIQYTMMKFFRYIDIHKMNDALKLNVLKQILSLGFTLNNCIGAFIWPWASPYLSWVGTITLQNSQPQTLIFSCGPFLLAPVLIYTWVIPLIWLLDAQDARRLALCHLVMCEDANIPRPTN